MTSAISDHYMSMDTRSEFSLYINGELGNHFSFADYDLISQNQSLVKRRHSQFEGDETTMNGEIIDKNPERDFSVIANQGIRSGMNLNPNANVFIPTQTALGENNENNVTLQNESSSFGSVGIFEVSSAGYPYVLNGSHIPETIYNESNSFHLVIFMKIPLKLST